MSSYSVVNKLNVAGLTPGQVNCLWIKVVGDGFGQSINVPVIVAKGKQKGPILGLTAAIHGNELNGLPTIHRLMEKLDVQKLCGAVVAVPILNVPGYFNQTRHFNDGTDLNRIMPGKKGGDNAEIYAYRVTDRIIRHVDYLIDLHTASFGRINSLYVRADLDNKVMRTMARLQNPQIIVHNVGGDKTLRGAAVKKGIPAITVEIGGPQSFQKKLIDSSTTGIFNVMSHLKMLPKKEKIFKYQPIWCKKSYWIYTSQGGILEVFPDVATQIKKGEHIARVKNIFGDLVEDYFAPENGVVIGKSTNPQNQTGARILHLGVLK